MLWKRKRAVAKATLHQTTSTTRVACLWTAWRVHKKECSALPSKREARCDANGLPMRIVYY